MKHVTLTMFCYLLMPLVSWVAEAAELALSVSHNHIKTDSHFYVDLNALAVPPVYGVQLVLQYDSKQLTLLDQDDGRSGIQVAQGDFFAADKLFTLRNDSEGGVINYTVSQVSPAKDAQGNGRLARLFFAAPKQAAQAKISIINAKFGTTDGQLVEAQRGASLELQFGSAYSEVVLPRSPYYYVPVVATLLAFGLLLLWRISRRKLSASGPGNKISLQSH